MIRFRPLAATDFPMLLEWLQQPHVKDWWDDGDDTLEKVATHYGDPSDDSRRFVLELDGDAAGYFQYYRIDATQIGTDQFLARPHGLSQGLGSRCLSAFIDMIAAAETVRCIIADPHPGNGRAIRCYEKCGFRHDPSRSTATIHFMTKDLPAG